MDKYNNAAIGMEDYVSNLLGAINGLLYKWISYVNQV